MTCYDYVDAEVCEALVLASTIVLLIVLLSGMVLCVRLTYRALYDYVKQRFGRERSRSLSEVELEIRNYYDPSI